MAVPMSIIRVMIRYAHPPPTKKKDDKEGHVIVKICIIVINKFFLYN